MQPNFKLSPVLHKVSASIQNTNVDGLEGLNLKLVAPFKVQDAVIGFRYALGSLKTLPESLFAQKSFDLGDSSLDVNADFNVNSNVVDVATRWTSNKFGLSVDANLDSHDKFKTVGLSKDLDISGNRLSVRGVYDLLKKKVTGAATLRADVGTVGLTFDSESQDPELSVTRQLDDSNSVTPSIRLRTGDLVWGYKREWTGGSLTSKLFPGSKKVSLTWKDKGAAGTWVTNADVPLSDVKDTKVSFAREWVY